MSDRERLRSGAMPGFNGGAEEQDEYAARYGDGLAPGQAARIADAVLAEPVTGHDGAPRGEWDHGRHSTAKPDNRRRPSGIRYGYGDPRR